MEPRRHRKDLIQLSSVFPFVSGINKSIIHHPTKHQLACQANAPCVVNAARRDGHVTPRRKLQNHIVAVPSAIPYDRTYNGYTSAVYVNGTGSSPGE
jgi:hypothetical protein